MRKAFDVEDLNLDDFIEVAMEDLKGLAGAERSFRGIDFNDLRTAYRQFCKMEALPGSVIDLGAVIDFYNKAVTDLPDHNKLKGIRLPGASVVLDRKGERFA
ncbi:MAG TPA: glycosyl transferase, partial [Xanthobacteraceae bacterium]|nr:glycosyl transferase [Xanthobacteraceae bacterium]